MFDTPQHIAPALITAIVNSGQGSRVLHLARRNGCTGGTVHLGRGTIPNKILAYFGVDRIEKEIVLMAASAENVRPIIEALDKQFHFEKPNHGIIFTKEVNHVRSLVLNYHRNDEDSDTSRRSPSMYQEITVVVPRGRAEEAVDAARKAGARGATIIHARGAGTHETTRILGQEIEPEKEIAMILVKREMAAAIIESIQQALGISEPGHGIIYTQDVTSVFGITE